jgi:hypothetical protein
MEYLFEPSFGGRHGNVFEVIPGGSGELCSNFIAYNNVTRNTNEGVNWWIQCPNFYIFNNVWANSGHYPPDPTGLMLSPPGSSGSTVVKAYIYNNTFQANKAQAGPSNSSTPGWGSGSSVTFANNHILDFTSTSGFFSCGSGDSCSMSDKGGEVFQTTAAANAQGYVLANDYVPDAAAAVACTLGTSGGVAEQSGWGGKIASSAGLALTARTGGWDAGAYEFASGTSSAPAPPTGLAATVQ